MKTRYLNLGVVVIVLSVLAAGSAYSAQGVYKEKSKKEKTKAWGKGRLSTEHTEVEREPSSEYEGYNDEVENVEEQSNEYEEFRREMREGLRENAEEDSNRERDRRSVGSSFENAEQRERENRELIKQVGETLSETNSAIVENID